MASHEELVAELVKLEKLSHAARLKHAKKRRQKQLKKYQEWLRYDRQTSQQTSRKRTPSKINFENSAVLNDLVSRNDLIGVTKILERGADPNISNADGLTPLHKCCIDNAIEMAEIILEHGVDLNARDIEGWTALHAAAATGNIQMINLLVEEGASLVAINNDDKMPIDVSADGDVRYVLQQKMIEAGYTDDVLEYIRGSVPKTMLADLKDSVKNDRSLNIQDKYGTSALHIAASNGYTEVMDFLLANEEVDLDIPDNEGWTPFHAAVCWNQPEMMRKLAEKGANMDLKNLRGETPYVIAEDPTIRQLILELKGEFGQSQEVNIEEDDMQEEMVARPARRMSVKRTSKEDKEKMAKMSVHAEASLRKASMAQHDLEMSLVKDKDKAVSDVIAGEDDDEAAILVRNKSISVAREASKLPSPTHSESGEAETPLHRVEEDKENSPTSGSEPSEAPVTNSRVRRTDASRPNRISQQEAFSKDRKPRKSVLKHTRHIPPRNSTYDSTTTTTTTSAVSPTASSPSVESVESLNQRNTRSPLQEDRYRKCCVVM